MRYLCDIMQDRQTKLFEECGTFFAFSQQQLDEKIKPNIKYVQLPGGMFNPKETAQKLIDGLGIIYKESIEEDMAENGKDAIILRELENHEAFYTGLIDATVEKLEDYPITRQEIAIIFAKEWDNHVE